MIAEEGLSLTDQQKIKVAFAEGYLAGNGVHKNPGKSVRLLKILQHVLTICLFIALFASLMGKVVPMFVFTFLYIHGLETVMWLVNKLMLSFL